MSKTFSATDALGLLSAPRAAERGSPLKDASFQAARTVMAAAVPKGPTAVLAAVDEVVAGAESMWAGLRATPAFALGTAPAACRQGCGWCCHQRIGAAAVEVLDIAERLRGGPEVARLAEWSPGRPCAFLDGGACRIYALRPLKCRSLYNLDVRYCMKAYAGIEAPSFGPPPSAAYQPEPMDVFEGAVHGLANALWSAGRDCPGVDFMPGLKAVIDRPDAAQRWWRGEAVFATADRLDWFPPMAKKKRK